MIVADASAVLEILLRQPRSPLVSARLSGRRQRIHAPHLLDAEVLHGLRRYFFSGVFTAERGQQAVDDFRDLRIQRYPHLVLIPRMWELRETLTAYDACYVALAEFLKAPLITLDSRLARTRGHQARIELIR